MFKTYFSLKKLKLKILKDVGNLLAVQWLGLCGLTAKGLGLIPGPGITISQAMHDAKKKVSWWGEPSASIIIYKRGAL